MKSVTVMRAKDKERLAKAREAELQRQQEQDWASGRYDGVRVRPLINERDE